MGSSENLDHELCDDLQQEEWQVLEVRLIFADSSVPEGPLTLLMSVYISRLYLERSSRLDQTGNPC